MEDSLSVRHAPRDITNETRWANITKYYDNPPTNLTVDESFVYCLLHGYYKTTKVFRPHIQKSTPIIGNILLNENNPLMEFCKPYQKTIYENMSDISILLKTSFNYYPEATIKSLVNILQCFEESTLPEAKYVIAKCLSVIDRTNLSDEHREILDDTIWYIHSANSQSQSPVPREIICDVDTKTKLLHNTPFYIGDFAKTLTATIIDAIITPEDQKITKLQTHFTTFSKIFETIANDMK